MHKASIISFLARSLFIFRRVLETGHNTQIKTWLIFFSDFYLLITRCRKQHNFLTLVLKYNKKVKQAKMKVLT